MSNGPLSGDRRSVPSLLFPRFPCFPAWINGWLPINFDFEFPPRGIGQPSPAARLPCIQRRMIPAKKGGGSAPGRNAGAPPWRRINASRQRALLRVYDRSSHPDAHLPWNGRGKGGVHVHDDVALEMPVLPAALYPHPPHRGLCSFSRLFRKD